MKIQLGKYSIFEPDKKAIQSYLMGIGLIIATLGLFRWDLFWYPIFIGAETFILIWLETTYYPYGVKPEDMKPIKEN